MTLGERIKYLRNLQGITQGQLADTLGVSRQIIYQYEHDETDPGLFIFTCMADALGVSLDYLARGEANEEESLP